LVYQHGIGKAGGVKTALEFAKTPFVLFMDGDGTYDPKDIWRLVNHTDHYSHVIGARNRRNIDHVHRFGNSLISHLFSLLFGTKVSDVCSGMYLLETDVARGYNLEEPGFVAEIELAAQSASTQELTEVPVAYRPRIGTRKLETWRDGRAILSAAFKLAWKYNPLLLCSGLACLLLVPALLTLFWVILEHLTGTWHLGWALLGTILLVSGTQALTLAGISVLTKNAERRLAREIRTHTAA
jgi:dolichol-phosphate mannosyltransferase